jgi:uncharacterized repeat protein (TIGR04138 family)
LSEQIKVDWKSIRQKAGTYPQEAYQFVRDGLQHTVKALHGEQGETTRENAGDAPDRHVSGQELCVGLRDYALNRYGMLARTVLARWGIVRTDDFGRIVFAMIDAGMMRRSDSDCMEDFRGVFDFDEAFLLTDVC